MLSGLERLCFVFWKKLWRTAQQITNWYQNSKPSLKKLERSMYLDVGLIFSLV